MSCLQKDEYKENRMEAYEKGIFLVAELTLKQKDYELYKEYYEKFKKILPVKEVAAVRRAEEDFKKEIINSIKNN